MTTKEPAAMTRTAERLARLASTYMDPEHYGFCLVEQARRSFMSEGCAGFTDDGRALYRMPKGRPTMNACKAIAAWAKVEV